ncbi:MAG: PEP-CTERM sorting domain-containing protein [Desulfobacterales bacterium]
MRSKMVIFLAIGLLLLSIGVANALPIKVGKGATEINIFSGNMDVVGWENRVIYEGGVQYTGNDNPLSKRVNFQFQLADLGEPAYFAVFRTKETKRGEITDLKWGEIFTKQNGKLKVRWHKDPLPLQLGGIVSSGSGGYGSHNGEGPGSNSPAPVPEPATMLLLGAGLIGLAGYGRSRIKNTR